MPEPSHIAKAQKLRALADELNTLADAVEQPSHHIDRSNQLIAEGERIAKATWSVFRG
ncbi:hypothetical protein U1839_06150 [Sphingomonas sp. RT2P30]|uniref:hypothetical protein n=1 Tax=Parasphingomonas halimpatiens TaxID=3096162 RepID=UPI002FC8313D